MRSVLLALLLSTVTAHAATVNNDNSCDISVLPAATLLLPYFEVDLDDPNGETTIFTVTNVTNLDQIARVTLWTDYAYPVINFNIYLTGYDVQAISLYDVIARGVIAPDAGTGTAVTKRGTYSDPNPALQQLGNCARLPGALDSVYIQRMQDAFTLGVIPPLGTSAGCTNIGGVHERATGYATIDLVGSCTTQMATDPSYWSEDIRYDNVLIGDYQQINGRENFAQGGAMVHIRAVPEGGTAATRMVNAAYVSGFGRTFYGRYQAVTSPRLDGRQPLPSLFATRWIDGGASNFETSMKVWREGRTDGDETCSRYGFEASRRVAEIVLFDENENAASLADGAGTGLLIPPVLPSTSRTHVSDSAIYPQLGNGSPGGWLYFNLDHTLDDDRASQNWVISSMRAQGRFSTDIDSIALGNGCSAPMSTSEITVANGPPIQPAPKVAPPSTGVATANNDDSCDIALLPAATLLLPYFEVDLDSPLGETTLFTVTNVSPTDQIARVTLWTDYAYPVMTFNVFLTGYDVQAINLYDLLARGVIGSAEGTGTQVTARGDHSTRNFEIDLSACRNLAGPIDSAQLTRLQQAFTQGRVPASAMAACNSVGQTHDNAVGYATIDLVRTCSSNIPTDAVYWTDDLLYDNVLIGDSQQVNNAQNLAQGSTMVHIRAIPDGGTSSTPSPFQRTFYSRYQGGSGRDRRQPLPSAFAARWIQGGSAMLETSYKIWREGETDLGATTCANWPRNVVPVREVIRFDERENAVGDVPICRVTCLGLENYLPAVSLTNVNDTSVFPMLTNGALGGWMYFNLDNDEFDGIASMNWVVVSMRAQGRFSVDLDAAALGNGCSLAPDESEVTVGTHSIGPAPNTP